MGGVIFKFDPEKDLLNIFNAVNSPLAYGQNVKIPQRLVNIAKGKDFVDCKEQLKEEQQSLYKSRLISCYLECIEKSWEKIEDEYFKRLKKLTNKDAPEEIAAYLTTVGKCPYDPQENSFMICFYSNLVQSMRSIGHEILHLHFHKNYFDYTEKIIGKSKTHDLKESLTVLLNLEFKDLWFAEDAGYEAHKELRKFIEAEWKKSHDFDRLLEKSIDFIKLKAKQKV